MEIETWMKYVSQTVRGLVLFYFKAQILRLPYSSLVSDHMHLVSEEAEILAGVCLIPVSGSFHSTTPPAH